MKTAIDRANDSVFASPVRRLSCPDYTVPSTEWDLPICPGCGLDATRDSVELIPSYWAHDEVSGDPGYLGPFGTADAALKAAIRLWKVAMDDGCTFTVHGVLAAAYKGKDVSQRSLLTHASTDGGISAVCRRVKEDSLCDLQEDGPPTCPDCARKVGA